MIVIRRFSSARRSASTCPAARKEEIMEERNVMEYAVEVEPEEIKWLTPPPREISPWVTLRLLAMGTPFIIFFWFFGCLAVHGVGGILTGNPPAKEGHALPGMVILGITATVALGIPGLILRAGLKIRRFLKFGEIGRGKVLKSSVSYIKGRASSQNVRYRFTANDGETHVVDTRVSLSVKLDETAYQVIFYDPKNPRRVLSYSDLWGGIAPDPETGEFRVTSVFSYPYTVMMLAIHLFFFTVLISELGVLFGIWAWRPWLWEWMIRMFFSG